MKGFLCERCQNMTKLLQIGGGVDVRGGLGEYREVESLRRFNISKSDCSLATK